VTLLDAYYILSYNGFPQVTVNTLKRLQIPEQLIKVVISSDDPAAVYTAHSCKQQGLPKPVRFNRERYLHDSYLSLMPETQLREFYPTTATPARRFISSREYRMPEERYYAVFDNDITFLGLQPFRLTNKEEFDHDVWERARVALQDPSVWACSFVNEYAWRASATRDGVPARAEAGSKWHRTGGLSAQSAWVLSNREQHRWYSPILEDYITKARYAAEGRLLYILDEYSHVNYTNTTGAIWGRGEDVNSRNTPAYQVGLLRIMGVSPSATGSKPFRKYSKYMLPQIRFE
jgi:hypothetical protein